MLLLWTAIAGLGATVAVDVVADAEREEMVAVGLDVVGGKQAQLAAVHSLRSWENARRHPTLVVREFWRCGRDRIR